MNILARDFDAKSLLKYTLPTIMMMLFLSTYTIVDGLFVARFVGEDAFTALNLVWPVFNIVLAIGLMFATGGTAVMGKLMGQGRESAARSFLSVLYIVAIALGVVVTMLIQCFADPIAIFLGVEDDLYVDAIAYLRALGFFATSFFLQTFVQSFFVLAGKPMVGFSICFVGGITNIALDFLFVSPSMLNLGITGAGYATGLGNCVPALFGIGYFGVNKRGALYFEKPIFNAKQLFRGMFNGVSELVSQLSMAITCFMFNIILLALVGKAGVASIGVILYIQMMQTALYFGYAIGVAPIISYKYGADDRAGLHNVLRISFRVITIMSLVVITLSMLFAETAVAIFISRESSTFVMAATGLRIFSIAYLFMGINIFMSSVFTALSNGAVSGILSMSRSLVFLVIALLALPHFIGITGVWLAVPVAELLAFLVSKYFYKRNRPVYGY